MVLITTALLVFVLLVLAAALLLFLYFERSFQYWKKRSVPHLKGIFPFGSASNVTVPVGVNLKILHQELKKQGVKHRGGIYIFSVPRYLVTDPQVIQEVLIRSFNNFSDRGVSHDKSDPLEDNFFVLERPQWQALRSKLLQSFTAAKLKLMFGTFQKFAGQMENALEKVCEKNKLVDLKQVAECFTIDAVGSSAFGVQCNSFKHTNTGFKRHLRGAFSNLALLRFFSIILIQFYPKLARLLRRKMYQKDDINFFSEVIKTVLAFGERNMYPPQDLMQFLTEEKECSSINENEKMGKISANVYNMFAGSIDSSSTIIMFCLYELAMHLDIQEKLRNEILHTLALRNEITYDAIMNMKYLDQVVCETLRKYPTLSFLFRRCVDDYKVPGTGIILEKGMFIFISILALHHDPEYFPEPQRFDPERFNEANKKNIRPFTYLPFGDGPRKCLGYRYADILIKIALVSFIRNYQVTLYTKQAMPLEYHVFSLSLFPKHKLLVKLKKRDT